MACFFLAKCDGCGSEMERVITVEISGSAASEFESLLVIARPPDSDEVITGTIVARYFKTSLILVSWLRAQCQYYETSFFMRRDARLMLLPDLTITANLRTIIT